jgi:hypothetical protein
VIGTREAAFVTAFSYLSGMPSSFEPVIVEAVDFGSRWRVFYGWRVRGTAGGASPVVVPLTIDKASGRIGPEWPIDRSTPSAQDAAAAVQGLVAPFLRESGLRGTRNVFTLPSKTHFARIGFKRSGIGSSAVVILSVIAEVIGRDAWSREAARFGWGKSPTLGVTYGVGEAGSIGEWLVFGGKPIEPLAEAILAAIRKTLPGFRERAGLSREDPAEAQ